MRLNDMGATTLAEDEEIAVRASKELLEAYVIWARKYLAFYGEWPECWLRRKEIENV